MALISGQDGASVDTKKPKAKAAPAPKAAPGLGEPKNDAPFTNPVGDDGKSYAVPGTPGGDLADAVRQAIAGSSNPASPDYTPTPSKPDVDYSGIDFSTYFQLWGMPSDVQARVTQIFQSTQDPSVAGQLALAYIRGTDWYGQTYPGIQIAEAKGLVSNEADYRALLNQQTAIYKQYLGRDITTDEFSANLNEGVNNTVIGQRLQGNAITKTYAGDWNYALGAFGDTGDLTADTNLNALGQEQAGLDTPMGQLLQKRLDLAKQRMAGVFKGTVATPSLGLSSGKLAGLQAGIAPDTAA